MVGKQLNQLLSAHQNQKKHLLANEKMDCLYEKSAPP